MNVLGRRLQVRAYVPPISGPTTQALTPAATRRGLKLSIIEGLFAQAHGSLTSGAIITGLALLLGAGNLTLAIIATIPLLMQPLQLVGAYLVERRGARIPLIIGGSTGRWLWLLLALLPYLPWSAPQRLGLLLLIIAASHALLQIGGCAWMHWATDMVPPRERGRYFGTRNTILATVAMTANYGAGWWLDLAATHAGSLANYSALFAVAGCCGIIGTALLTYHPEPPMQQTPRLHIRDVICKPLRNIEFRHFLYANMAWQIALGIASPFFSAHALSVLNLSFKTLATFDGITAATSLLVLPLAGRLADRFGHRRVLIAAMVLVAPLPWNWVLATPDTIWTLYIGCGIAGIGWPTITLALGNRLMEQVPAEGRGSYLAVYATTTGLTCFLASALGGWVADALAAFQLTLGSVVINNYCVIFILASILRGAVPFIWRKTL